METIIDYLVRHLRNAGQKRWGAICAEINADLGEEKRVGEALLRKIAYGDRTNPGIETIQPLLSYFQAVDRGQIELPEPEAKAA